MKIQIDLDNDENNLPKAAIFSGLVWIPEVNQIVLKSKYGVYQNDQFTYNVKELQQLADNSTYVNPKTGEYVDADYPGAVGEYDFFMGLIQNPVEFIPLIQSYMNKAKDAGRYV